MQNMTFNCFPAPLPTVAVGEIKHWVSLCVHVRVFSPQDESGSVHNGGLCACEDLISISKYGLLLCLYAFMVSPCVMGLCLFAVCNKNNGAVSARL